MSVDEVCDWLSDLSLPHLAGAFRENRIDGTVLPTLTDADLKEIGVSALGDRRKVLMSAQEFSSGANAPSAASPATPQQPAVLSTCAVCEETFSSANNPSGACRRHVGEVFLRSKHHQSVHGSRSGRWVHLMCWSCCLTPESSKGCTPTGLPHVSSSEMNSETKEALKLSPCGGCGVMFGDLYNPSTSCKFHPGQLAEKTKHHQVTGQRHRTVERYTAWSCCGERAPAVGCKERGTAHVRGAARPVELQRGGASDPTMMTQSFQFSGHTQTDKQTTVAGRQIQTPREVVREPEYEPDLTS
uniref:SAM domain-containing protein n=1 Tax=Chromera velia CCMP2878 TaxID=1169474 RepID=A0A0G4H4K4_9ALVE|eukprot:Cvel_837.t1-p1 / transcript=Cvel_837.t1 / gene=Cvel_837 / organism=Chromera_velia_CCMP2878 / gene_product=hypothetical protein / transcript_product=hypothetical protein / location=Cvel_scaffold26:48262-49158(+) / protein_length=299 / sequence_SO=supercontig / SO=protein_coding / is_pseudo=false